MSIKLDLFSQRFTQLQRVVLEELLIKIKHNIEMLMNYFLHGLGKENYMKKLLLRQI